MTEELNRTETTMTEKENSDDPNYETEAETDYENDAVSNADEADDNELKEWDEGGPSHCGYSQTVHDTLMSVGKTVHAVVGEPGMTVKTSMRGIGNWFQEASYAVRDCSRGEETGLAEDAGNVVSSLVGAGAKVGQGNGNSDELLMPDESESMPATPQPV
mmetsp:Transcript_3252/g.4933  ORF Transcript_3252/g.4933 Transcript_3252/m.4933 type:complete len:160 (-) Transcript_3252:153-632(-)